MERSYSTVEGTDVLRWSMGTTVTVDEIRQLYADQAAFSKGKSSFFVIVDLRRMEHIGSEARREAARAPLVDGKPMPVGAIAIIGGSFHMRILGTMINKAASALNRIKETPIGFFDTDEEAKQWFEKFRQGKTSR